MVSRVSCSVPLLWPFVVRCVSVNSMTIKVVVRDQTKDEKRNDENTEGTSRPYVFITQSCLLSPLLSSCPGAFYLLLRLGIPGSLVFSPDLRCRSSRWDYRKVEQQDLSSGRIVGPLSSCS